MHHHAEKRRRAVAPFVEQLDAVDAGDVDVVERTSDGVEAGRIDDDVEIIVAGAGAQAGFRYPLDRRLADIDEMHVVAVVGLEIMGLQRHPLHPEAVIPRYQLFRGDGILDAATDAIGNVGGKFGVGRFVGEYLAEIAQPDAKAGFAIELVPQRDPLFARHLVEAAPVRFVLESARRAGACCKYLVIARTDVGHLLVRNRTVVERRAPVRPALEHGEVADLVGDLTDDLDGGGAGADDGDLLAREIDRLVGPIKGMERAALEGIHAFEARRRRRREQADREHDEAAGQFAAVVELQTPQMLRLVEPGRLDLAVELHVFAQVELVRDVIEIAQVLRLPREALLPVPLVEQFLRERVAVGIALGIEPRTGVAVPVPGSAEIGSCLQHQRVDAEIGQPLDLVDAGHARTDHDDFVVRPGALGHARLPRYVSWTISARSASLYRIIRAPHLRLDAGFRLAKPGAQTLFESGCTTLPAPAN